MGLIMVDVFNFYIWYFEELVLLSALWGEKTAQMNGQIAHQLLRRRGGLSVI